MIDVEEPGTDGYWLRRLLRSMHTRPQRVPGNLAEDVRAGYTRNEWLHTLWARYTGNTPLQVSEKYAPATREFLRLTRHNFAALIVESLQERTQFVGAVVDGTDDPDGDDTVRAFLDGNGPFMADALTYAYALGSGFVMVSPPPTAGGVAAATAEDPRQVAHVTDPVTGEVRAAVKVYRDEDTGADVAHLFMRAEAGQPDRVRVAFRTGTAGWSGARFSPAEWEWDDSRSGPLPVQGLGVPLVPVVNKLGLGEFEPHLDLLDRISNGIADRLWSAKYQIHIQRAIMGNLPDTDDDGNPIDYDDLLSADPGALWRLPEDVKIWESRQLDVNALLAPVRDDIKELSAVSRTPLFMFSPDSMTGSAEGASLARESLVFKANDRISRFKPAAARIAQLGAAYSGRPLQGSARSLWLPAERYSLEQRGSAAVQAKTSGVPQQSILSDVWQFDPVTVARMLRERRADLLYQVDAATVRTSAAGG